MPEIDGFTVLEMLSKTAPGGLPVLVLTARHPARRPRLPGQFTEAQLVARLMRVRPLAA